MDFTTDPRKNLTAIASAEPLPFTSELEYARTCLAVAQAQYENALSVEYDTPHTWLRMPPLTLQPIVENAVKHGRDPYAGPLHISVRTLRKDSRSVIIVSDDGCGFHLRQRLEIMWRRKPDDQDGGGRRNRGDGDDSGQGRVRGGLTFL